MINELEKKNTALSIKVEEYQGHLQLYEKQLSTRQEEVKSLHVERKEVYSSLIQSQIK